MSKRTRTSLIRKYEVVDKKLVKRDIPIAQIPTRKKPCRVCGEDMIISIGQKAEFHKKCRTLGRKRKLIYTV